MTDVSLCCLAVGQCHYHTGDWMLSEYCLVEKNKVEVKEGMGKKSIPVHMSIGWMAMTFGTDIHASLKMKYNNLINLINLMVIPALFIQLSSGECNLSNS